MVSSSTCPKRLGQVELETMSMYYDKNGVDKSSSIMLSIKKMF